MYGCNQCENYPNWQSSGVWREQCVGLFSVNIMVLEAVGPYGPLSSSPYRGYMKRSPSGPNKAMGPLT